MLRADRRAGLAFDGKGSMDRPTEGTSGFSTEMKEGFMRKAPFISFAAMVFLAGCTFRNRSAAVGVNPAAATIVNPIVRTTGVPLATATLQPTAKAALVVKRSPGGTHKICQLTGDTDRELGRPTLNRTGSRYGVLGTDLGFSFPFDTRLFFLFGDTLGVHGGDSIAYSADTDPEDCLELSFVTGSDGRYLPTKVPGISLGAFEVAVGGFGAGNKMYVFFTTDHTAAKVMGRSVLARSDNGAKSFALLYDVSNDKFINITPAVVDNSTIPGLPESGGQGLLLWGTGDYRKSNPYLAYVPLSSVEDRGAWRFYSGLDPAAGLPRWSEREADAAALFDHPCLGELSVAWYASLSQWLMTYNCIQPRGITLRSADAPWGPWSGGEVIFQPWDDGGYCHFMHVSYESQNCDTVQDSGRDNEWAGEYGPYMIPSLARSQGGVTTIYYLMSVWNPYEVMLMKTDLMLR
jgi:hypothetical protein